MCECHQLTKQCQPIDEKIKKKKKECGFVLTKYETLHLLQWTQNHLKQHYGMLSFPHHRQNERGGSQWGLKDSHRYNVSK
jgi:hypothetical protein